MGSAMLGILSSLDASLTRGVQKLSLGPLEVLLLHHYAPFVSKRGRFDDNSGAFGWKGMMYFSLPLTAVVTAARISDFLFVMLTVAVGQIFNRTAKQLLGRHRPTPPPAPLPARFFDVYIPLSPDDPDGASFPSGDTMAGSSIAFGL